MRDGPSEIVLIKKKNCSFLRIPRLDGILSTLSFYECRVARFDKFLNSFGTSPVMPFLSNVGVEKKNAQNFNFFFFG